MTNRFLVISALALGAVLAQPLSAQTAASSSPPPAEGDNQTWAQAKQAAEPADKAPAVAAQPPRKAYEPRRAEKDALREARRREAVEAARNPDFTGGIYDPVKDSSGKP